jgi:glutamate-1-semialdehyde 2,1-aminomutase
MPTGSNADAPWRVRDEDREFFAHEIDSFLPDRIFDAHCHLYRVADFHGPVPPLAASGPAVVDWPSMIGLMEAVTPSRRYAGLAFGFPADGLDIGAANEFLAGEAAAHPACRGQMVVSPAMDAEQVRETVRRHRLVGLKCYHVYSPHRPSFDSRVEDYLSEEHVRVAHEEGLSITLHMVKARALADPANQESIRRLALRYPNSRWILAHAARGFNVHHTIAGIGSLCGIPNIWCDTSAVTEAGAYEAIVRTLGFERLLYGTDFPVSHIRGRCVAIGDSFVWLSSENTRFEAAYAAIRPVLVMLESLRALKQALWNLHASDAQIEAVFSGNAAGLYGPVGF